ncbi:type I-F CRISPR-associated protein Csy1 [Pseudomonas panipatensis]|uniref:type I-F CRISPR-associated protein Csy1 n=1 Tax=Pseudomonas panipatensis TaxID=428992 RepID=UPI0035B3B97E
MASPALSREALDLRQSIQTFIDERLQAKLAKLKPDEDDKRQALIEAHRREAWLADAARRVGQIQLATHTLKPLHPDARGSNLHVVPPTPPAAGMVGTHSLGADVANDVVGNAAALDVFKFLSLELDGRSLLQRLLADDAEMRAALSDDPAQADEWRHAFAGITQGKGNPASHTLAKQLYFPLPGGGYHLLAPLFPTSLVHRVHRRLREDRFGEAAKAARDAWRKREDHPHGYREYPNLAIQKFGGTKPQNISQLNSERYGENWLLASLPPQWESPDLRLPLRTESAFTFLFGHSSRLRKQVRELRHFLATTTHNNLAIRRKRARLLQDIGDEFQQYAAQLREQSASAGWSASPECLLHEAEQLWLDPLRVHDDPTFRQRRLQRDWPLQASQRFANWLNSAIQSKDNLMGEDEAAQWSHDLHQELTLFKEVLDDDRR